MALKLLTRKDALLENKELGIKLRLGLVLPEHVAELGGLFRQSHDPAATVAIYALRECVSELAVDGQEYNPKQASYQIDTMDADNRGFLSGISALIIQELMVSDEMRKKQASQLPLISTEKAA